MYCTNRECPDFEQSGVAGEYAEPLTVCPVCGAELSPSPPEWIPTAVALSSDDDPFVPCLTVEDVALLPHIKAILDVAGVAHFVKHEGVQHLIGWGTAVFGFNPITGPPVVMVSIVTARSGEGTPARDPAYRPASRGDPAWCVIRRRPTAAAVRRLRPDPRSRGR